MTSAPDPSTARVIPSALSAPWWAALSMPTASPLVMASPRSARHSGELAGRVRALRSRIAAADDGKLRFVQHVRIACDI